MEGSHLRSQETGESGSHPNTSSGRRWEGREKRAGGSQRLAIVATVVIVAVVVDVAVGSISGGSE